MGDKGTGKSEKITITAKNGLESYLYNLKNTLNDEEKGVGDKISAGDKKDLEDTIDEALDWLEDNPEADTDEYDAKRKEVENIANPVMRNVYGAGAGGAEDDMGDFGDDEL